MAGARRKTARRGVIKGHGTSDYHDRERGPCVVLSGEVTDDADAGRPVVFKMTPAEARKWAAGLIRMAELCEARTGAAPEAEQASTCAQDGHCGCWELHRPGVQCCGCGAVKPAPTGKLAELLGLTTASDQPVTELPEAEDLDTLPELPDAQGRWCSRCHQDHRPQDCFYKV